MKVTVAQDYSVQYFNNYKVGKDSQHRSKMGHLWNSGLSLCREPAMSG